MEGYNDEIVEVEEVTGVRVEGDESVEVEVRVEVGQQWKWD